MDEGTSQFGVCMSWEGVEGLTKIEGNMSNKHYQNILHDNMSMSVVKIGNQAEE